MATKIGTIHSAPLTTTGEGVVAEPVAPEPHKPRAPATYRASIHPTQPLPRDFADAVVALEKTVGGQLWLLLQRDAPVLSGFDTLEDDLVAALSAARAELPQKPVFLLIDSPGGFAKCAYQIATMLKRHCGGFTAVVPRYAKSAATLLALGADRILLGKFAELGPLDAQFDDPEREHRLSALDEVQALERLHAFGLEAVDRSMFLMLRRTGKKVETLLPLILRFVTDMTRPLFEKIDAVHYTQMSRTLKVAEEYAIRLLATHYPLERARQIARHLVENYPEHGFVVDGAEAATFGLETETVSAEQQRIIDAMLPFLGQLTAIGRLKEEPANEE